MMNMFGFQGLILLSPEQRARRTEMRKQAVERRLAQVVSWDQDTKWAPELNIRAESYMRHRQATPSLQSLFQVQGTRELYPERVKLLDNSRVISKCGRWLYCEKELARGECLEILRGRQRGTVMFDGSVSFPAIHELGHWRNTPWMSLTPNEIFTLRIGTKFAKGHVVVAGLGLGHQLIEVLLRKQVTKVTLVEKSQGLVDFVLSKIIKILSESFQAFELSASNKLKNLDIAIGNAQDLVPKIQADVALVDIFSGYGGNTFTRCQEIKKVWCWGGA